jgi:DNA-damage-inducible protein J
MVFVIQMNYNPIPGSWIGVPAMAATALVQTRIDPVLKERAAAVLDNMGLTVSDAVRILQGQRMKFISDAGLSSE